MTEPITIYDIPYFIIVFAGMVMVAGILLDWKNPFKRKNSSVKPGDCV